ncbi:hypothetical protein FKW77_010235 [Venturia effusa]|uniref:Uncharacterized protein n=1 Tax=Venturia effusa TaxID=50376 RepID=A0A517KXM0_9PEZI|nr:hypothetical protein FKW77_010235 [Venturia effusa]
MSRPYQFGDNEDKVTSPLDRRAAAPYAQGQAPSFKTNVNRAKTKKWVEAKAPSYGGDDWDDYDEEDQYGVEAARDAPLPPLPSQGRSFTTPVPPTARSDRRNSFDAGDERRAFSSGFTQLPTGTPQASSQVHVPLHVETSVASGKAPATDSPSQHVSATRLPSASSDLSSTNPEHRRDFSPSALPTPLRAGNSQVVASSSDQFPPQQPSSHVAQHASATDPPLSASPPSSFIRPADIYKRHLEEEQRRSLEPQRQSLDSESNQEVANPVQGRTPLDTVAERTTEYGLPASSLVTAPETTSAGARSSFAGLAMPTGIGGDTGFGDEFWGSTVGGSTGMPATASASNLSPMSGSHDPALQHQPSLGFTSLVHQAFDTTQGVSKQDSLRSQDAAESIVSRSNTTGTSDISPIMSRVPSSATAAAKLADRRQATPAIEEEAEGTSRPTSQTTEDSIPVGFTPGFRRDLNTPSPNNSPARSPAVEASTQSSLQGVAAEVGLHNPAAREADIVEAIASSPDKDTALLASVEKSAQGAFIQSHKSDIPDASPKITRAESPSKGRVADLAGRFDVGPSRKGSVESWEAESPRSKRSSSASPVKDEAPTTLKPVTFERPQAEREISFRPKLPGAFESYATTRSTSPVKTSDASPQLSAVSLPEPPKDEFAESSDVDFTPTSAKRPIKGKDLTGSNAGPLAALAAAGAVMGEAFMKSMGSEDEPVGSTQPGDRLRGDVYSRPAPPERLDTDGSSLPPTPLPKDDAFQPLVPSKERDLTAEEPEAVSPLPARPTFNSQPSMESGPGDYESDRLRREIVRSLSPDGDARLSALAEDSVATRGANRTSNAIPSEYDSYWAAGDDDEALVASESTPKEVSTSLVMPISPPELRSKSASPNYLDKRFSWEKREDEAAAAVAAAAVLGGSAAVAAHHASGDSSATHPASTIPTAAVDDKRSSTLEPKTDVLSLNPKLSGEGLHIVNAEPGELPTPEEAAPLTPNRFSHMAPELYVPTERELGGHGGLSPVAGEPVSPISSITGPPAGPRPPSGPRPKTGEEPRPASFREILAIKSTPARIAKYEETRQQFASTNTGLGNWLSRTLEAHPEHREIAAAALRPAMNPIGPPGPRHKTNASISRVFTSKEGSPATSAHVDPGAEYKSGSVSAGASDQRASTGKSKDLGKDIFKTAGVLGGKGMKEAKGFFSKGKSRFRGSGTDKGYGMPPANTNTLAILAPNGSTDRQRIVSMLRSEKTVPDHGMDDPVSPISPEESNSGGSVHNVRPDGDTLSSSSLAVSLDVGSRQSPKQNNVHLYLPPNLDSQIDISRDNSIRSVSNEDVGSQARIVGSSSWEEVDNTRENGTGTVLSEESASDSEEPSGPKQPKGKGRADDLAYSPVATGSLGITNHSRGTSASSAILEHAQSVQLESQATLEPTRHVALRSNDRLKDGADRLAAIAEAHRKMRAQFQEDDAVRETPHDFLIADLAAKNFDRASLLQQSLQVPSQNWGAGPGIVDGRPRGRSITSTRTMPTAVGPGMAITEPMPDDQLRTRSLGATTGDNAASLPLSMLPSLEVIPRSMPSVSSMGHEDTKSSVDQSPAGQEPPVSPVKVSDSDTACETRVYNPPRPALERPMSFTPLARDSFGLPVQEMISTAKHPLDLDTQFTQAGDQEHTPPSTGIRRSSRQFDSPQSTSPSGLRRMSRQFDAQGNASPKGRRKSRQVSLGAVQNPTEIVPNQPQSSQSSTPRPMSMADTDSPPGSRTLSMEFKDPYRPIQLYDRPSSGASTNFLPPTSFQIHVNSNLRHDTADVRHQGTGLQDLPVHLAPVDPTKKQGLFQRLKKKTSSAPVIPHLTIQGPTPSTAQETTSIETQRLMSLQSRVSTVHSEDVPSPKDKRKRSSFLGVLRRPASAEANSIISGESSPQKYQRSTEAHHSAPAQLQFTQTMILPSPQDSKRTAGLKSKKEKLPHRALTHTGQEVPGKKRFSGLGNLFGRSGTTGHAPNTGKKWATEQSKGTILHRVPDNPATRAFQEQQRLQAAQWQSVRQGQHPQDLPLSPNQIVGHSGRLPSTVGYYASTSISPPSDPNFGYLARVAGHDAITAQQSRPALSSPVSSPTGSTKRWLSFGRKESAGSRAILSPQVSADMEHYQRHNSGGSVSSISTRRNSSPAQFQVRPSRGLLMGSITETPGQHQERPWALNIPNEQEDDGERELMRQEIFHAASARWRKGSDGQIYAVPEDQPLQSPLESPRYPTFTSHSQFQAQQQYTSPDTPAYPYPRPQTSPSMPPQVPIYQPTGSPAQPLDAWRSYEPASEGQYQPVGIPGEYQRFGYNPPPYPAPTAPDEPQIPPLPQGRLQLIQPQPKRLSFNASPVNAAASMFDHALEDPRLDSTFRSRSNLPASGVATISADPIPQSKLMTSLLPSRGVGSAPPPRGVANLRTSTSMPISVNQLPRPHSYSPSSSHQILYQHHPQQPFEPQSAHSTGVEDLDADPSRQLLWRDNVDTQTAHVQGENDGLPPPPPLAKDDDAHVPLSQQKPEMIPHIAQAVSGQGLGGHRIAAALAQAGVVNEAATERVVHQRNLSESSDEIPVMKASGYPGDEWVPSWDGLD